MLNNFILDIDKFVYLENAQYYIENQKELVLSILLTAYVCLLLLSNIFNKIHVVVIYPIYYYFFNLIFNNKMYICEFYLFRTDSIVN